MSGMQNYARRAQRMSGSTIQNGSNNPCRYVSRQTEYLEGPTKAFYGENAKWASDYFKARVQGLNPDDFYAWWETTARMADVVKPGATTITKPIDDYKLVLFDDRRISYVPAGTKLEAMGSTWICVNPNSVSGGTGTGLFQRCNAAWNYLDFYGNVCSEPIAVKRSSMMANNPDEQRIELVAKGYFDVVCQYNEATRQLGQNSRMILGASAYAVTGFTDFVQEFTGDYDTVRLLQFTIRYQEPNESDDMVHHVANGKEFSWQTAIQGPGTLTVGSTGTFTAGAVRNGAAVVPTEAHPVTYTWTSSDPETVSVTENGEATAHKAGSAVLTAALKENPGNAQTASVEAVEGQSGGMVRIVTNGPGVIYMMETAKIRAEVLRDGEVTGEAVTWAFSGADAGCWRAVPGNENELAVTCMNGSDTPLTVTAKCGELEASAVYRLKGM